MARTSKSQISEGEINKQIVNFIDGITSIGASSRGDEFDEVVKETLLRNLPAATLIPCDRWNGSKSGSIFRAHASRCLKKNFDFTDLPPIVDNGAELDLIVVDKPNGKQQWPDLLIVFNGVGFPIEVKSSREDKIVWNSGFPKSGSLYIFNCYGKARTTAFLGEHSITDEELLFLQNQAKLAASFNESNGKWSYYARNMFNSNQSYIENLDLKKRAEEANKKISEVYEDLNLAISEGKHKQIEQCNDAIEKLIEKKDILEATLKEQITQRKKVERETRKFVSTLTWDSSQKTSFSLKNDIIENDEIETLQRDTDEHKPESKIKKSRRLGTP